MFRGIWVAGFAMLMVGTADAKRLSFLFCENQHVGEDQRLRTESIPLFYQNGELIALGHEQHCLDAPKYEISHMYASWKCVTAFDADQTPVQSVFVQINRYTGRYHRNDIQGHYKDASLSSIISVRHGMCKIHHEAQF